MGQTSVSNTLTAALQGQLGDGSPKAQDSFVNAEATDEIPFGVMVKQGTGDNDALKLSTVNDDLVGVVVLDYGYNKDNELGDVGIKPDVVMGVISKGRVWVPVEEAVTPASNVLVRAVASGNEVAGAFRDTADASDCIDISAFARFRSTTTGEGLALLEFDLTNRRA